MKAVKINKIQWNLGNLTDEQKEQVMLKLPTQKGFVTEDNFNVTERVPYLLKKKFGYDIVDFSFVEIHIAETISELLKTCAPAGKEKNLFTDSGNLSAYGKMCKENLENAVKERIQLERKGTSAYAMPKRLDAVMLGIEKISGLSWDAHTPDELLAPIYRKIWDQKAVNLKDMFERNSDEDED